MQAGDCQDEGRHVGAEEVPERQVRRRRRQRRKGRAVVANVPSGDAARPDRARDRAGQPIREGHRDGGRRYESRAPEDPKTGSQDQEAHGGGGARADAPPCPSCPREAQPLRWRRNALRRCRHAAVARPRAVPDPVQAHVAGRGRGHRRPAVGVGQPHIPEEPPLGQEGGDVPEPRVPRLHLGRRKHLRVRDAVAFQEAEAVLQDAVPGHGASAADAAQVPGQVAPERAGVQAQDPREGCAAGETHRRRVTAAAREGAGVTRENPALLVLAV
ncbi:hypothetical protein BDA96_05G125800 [Sorghum bicolor]|uniref:Uncharacterized protein n=1 Tax=Sorghum bicolor TaxID=4558 RepID=A0A921QY48_SORBI|nr:hypothetical protein BDA96_05G125800 [Sorghum bicolor]